MLISRGTCSFEEKVRNAQDAGFQAAIIYDDLDKGNLYSSKWLYHVTWNGFVLSRDGWTQDFRPGGTKKYRIGFKL